MNNLPPGCLPSDIDGDGPPMRHCVQCGQEFNPERNEAICDECEAPCLWCNGDGGDMIDGNWVACDQCCDRTPDPEHEWVKRDRVENSWLAITCLYTILFAGAVVEGCERAVRWIKSRLTRR